MFPAPSVGGIGVDFLHLANFGPDKAIWPWLPTIGYLLTGAAFLVLFGFLARAAWRGGNRPSRTLHFVMFFLLLGGVANLIQAVHAVSTSALVALVVVLIRLAAAGCAIGAVRGMLPVLPALVRARAAQTILESEERLRASVAALSASEERFRGFMDNSPAVAWMKDGQGRYVYINQPYERRFGVRATKLRGQTDWELWPAETARRFRDNDQIVRETRQPLRVEEQAPDPDGTIHEWEGFKFLIRGPAGEDFVGGISVDVTERKRAARQVAESEERFRALARLAPVGIFLTDSSGRAVFVNDRWRELAGMDADQALGQSWLAAIHPNDRGPVFDAWSSALAAGREFFAEFRFQTPQGQSTWLEGRALSLATDGAEGAEGAGFLGTVVDISDRRRVEDILRQANDLLEARVRDRTAALERSNQRLRAEIDERGRLVARIQLSEERFRALAHTIPQIVWSARPDGYIDYFNQRWYDYTGKTPEQSIGWGWHDMLHPDDLPDCIARWASAVGTGSTFEIEYRFRRAADGAYRWHFGRGAPIRDARGEILRWCGTCADVDDQRRAEEELRSWSSALEQRALERARELSFSEEALRTQTRILRSVLDAMADGVLVADRENRFLHSNSAAERILGRAMIESRPENWNDQEGLFHPDRRTLYGPEELPLARALRGEFVDGVEVLVRRRDNPSDAWALCSARPLVADDGVTWGGVVVFRDVTSRKEMEQALRASEEKLRLALAAAGMGTWEYDLRSEVVSWSEHGAAVVGRTHGEFSGTFERMVGMIHPEDRAYFLAAARSAHAGAVNSETIELEFRLIHVTGEIYWLRVAGRLLRDAGGAPARIIGTFTNTTPRRVEVERLERSLREKEALLKEIHHRVKNNLQVISSLLSLQSSHLSDPAVVALFTESQGRVRSMAMIHEGLYRSGDLARIDFAEYARELAHNLRASLGLEAAGVRLLTDLEPILLGIDAAVPCGLILNELVTNCFKHAFVGRTAGTVAVSLCREAPGRARLRVADDGVGCAAGFEPGATGTLGLRLVRTLSQQIEGELRYFQDNGLRVELSFPMADEVPAAAPGAARPAASQIGARG